MITIKNNAIHEIWYVMMDEIKDVASMTGKPPLPPEPPSGSLPQTPVSGKTL